MSRWLVTGASGMLATELLGRLEAVQGMVGELAVAWAADGQRTGLLSRMRRPLVLSRRKGLESCGLVRGRLGF